MRILVAAASKHGSTWDIACSIGSTLAAWGIRADVAHMEDVDDLSIYDGFVLGSAAYTGRWLKQASEFVCGHAADFTGRPVWLFSSGPLGFPLKPHESKAVDIRPITKLIRIREHRVLAGRLKRFGLDLVERIITAVVRAPQGDFRNWEEIHSWAVGIAQSLKRQAASKRVRV